MLVNLKNKPRQRSKWQKFCRKLLRDPFYSGEERKDLRNDIRRRSKHFNWILRPYVPCGLEYVKDKKTDFTGVYIDTYGIGEHYIQNLTYNKVIQSLVDYGNVDNASQAIEEYEKLKSAHPEEIVGNHIILLRPIIKYQNGGFRWHKNGYYSGKANAGSCEYFDDETDADLKMVWNYNIIQVSEAKEEDFGDVKAMNAGRISSIRYLRNHGLNNLAALAKRCGYVYCSDGGCCLETEDEERYFRFEWDETENLIAVAPEDITFSKKRLMSIPDVNWTK